MLYRMWFFCLKIQAKDKIMFGSPIFVNQKLHAGGTQSLPLQGQRTLGSDLCRKPQKTVGTRRKLQIGVCPLRFVPLSVALDFAIDERLSDRRSRKGVIEGSRRPSRYLWTVHFVLYPLSHRVLQGATPRGRQLYFTFLSAPDPLLKASKAPFLTLRAPTP